MAVNDVAGSRRYYTPGQVLFGALLGGPIAGGYLLSRNHVMFGASKKAVPVLLVSGVVVLGAIALNRVMPPRASHILPPVIIAVLYRAYAESAFSAPIAKSFESGSLPYSWWRVAGLSFSLLLATCLTLFLALLMLPDSWAPE